MAFCIKNLSVLAYSSGFTLWLYRAMSDGGSVFSNPDFFDGAGDVLAEGDIVMVYSRAGSRMLRVVMDGAGTRTVATI